MDAMQRDNNFEDLLPEFADKIKAVIAEATRESAGKFPHIGFMRWEMYEGWRSQERQTALYEQGRSKPGDIVTDARTTPYHGAGIAADCVWIDTQGRPRWDGPDDLWQVLRHCAHLQGLITGEDWDSEQGRALGDKGHIQPPEDAHIAEWQSRGHAYLHSKGLE